MLWTVHTLVQVLGMAERGYLPRVFAMRSNFGTPVIGIMLSSIGIVTMLMFDFMQIVELLNAVYCLAELMEFAAFIKLRWKHPDLKRVYKCAATLVSHSVHTVYSALASEVYPWDSALW